MPRSSESPAAATRLALVVGGLDTGESDRIVHLLTPEGRLDAYAPAAKRSRKRFGGALEPLQTIEAHLHRKTTGLVTLRSAHVLRPRLKLRADLERIALASYGAEVSRMVAPEGEPTPLFDEVTALLDALETHPACPSLRRSFELRTLAAMGYRPEAGACALCGSAQMPAFFDLERGGRTCAAHRDRGPRLSESAATWLEGVLAHPPGVGDDAAARQLGPAIDRFLLELLERPPKSLRWMQDLGLL